MVTNIRRVLDFRFESVEKYRKKGLDKNQVVKDGVIHRDGGYLNGYRLETTGIEKGVEVHRENYLVVLFK